VDPRADECARQGLHGLVTVLVMGKDRDAGPSRQLLQLAARTMFPLAVATALLAAIAGGLGRAGVTPSFVSRATWLGSAVSAHAFLMMVAFMGTVIGLERAVALKRGWCWLAPSGSAAAGLAMLLGFEVTAQLLAVSASIVFLAANLHVVTRQPAGHTVLLLVGAASWFVGNLALLADLSVSSVMPWWFAFLVLTIAAERLEMTRLMRRRRGAAGLLVAALVSLLVGAVASLLGVTAGAVLYGLSLMALALWLVVFDIARRTVTTQGLSRYMAICLLTGYAWLAVAGAAWVGMSLGLPTRDIALHALGLGFVFSMMLGHAPVILPALLRVKVLFGWPFYVAFFLLHGSLVVRLLAGSFSFVWLSLGAIGNVLAIFTFAATMAGAALAWRLRHGPQRSRHRADPAED